MKPHAGDVCKCNYCSKSFDYQDNFRKHARTHNFEPCFDCNRSDETSKPQNYLYSHEMINMSDSRLVCDKYGKQFQRRTSFVSHRPWHIGPNPCPYCQKLFNQNKNLQKHVSTHSANANKCTVCARTLSRIETIDKHAEDNHENISKPCTLCKEGFRSHKPSNIDMAASCHDKDTQHGTTDVLDSAEKAEK